MGFLSPLDLPELLKLDRLCQVLVRCGGCRFSCAVQDYLHLAKCVTAGGDYVRDVSFSVGAFDRAAGWRPEMPVVFPSALKGKSVLGEPMNKAAHNEARKEQMAMNWRRAFDEADCSGAFDGHQVTSDADSGL